jgi:hypothetical protein
MFSTCKIIDMIIMKDFRLYENMVVKSYRLVGDRQVYLNNAEVILTNTNWRKICIIPKGSYLSRIKNRIIYDSNLGGGNSLEDFKIACESLGIKFEKSRDGLTGRKI